MRPDVLFNTKQTKKTQLKKEWSETMIRSCTATIAALTAAVLMSTTGPGMAQTPKKGGMLNFGVVAEPPNYDCHGSTTFALIRLFLIPA